MDMNSLLESFNNLLKSINNNNNNNLIILILIILGLYFAYISNTDIVNNSIYLFDNTIFKLSLFMIITCITGLTPVIGIVLALIMFVNLQIITYTKFKKELDDDIHNILEEVIKI